MAECNKFQELEESGEVLVAFINSSQPEKLRQVKDAHQTLFNRHVETKKTVTQILKDVAQIEETAGQRLLDMKEEQKKRDQEFNSLEERLNHLKSKSQMTNSELQFLQREFEALINNKRDLESLQVEVDKDTTEIIPSAVHVAQLYYLITKIKWEYDTEPSVLKGVHYGAELAAPINVDKSSQTADEISDHLWSFVSTEW